MGAEVSRQTISTITDQVLEDMVEWQSRPLDAVYPLVFIDAIHVKIRDGVVTNRPIYVALAVTTEGRREILGLWAGDGGEGAKHWLHILTEIKNRGVSDVLMLVCDGLKGLPEAVETVWPRTIAQTSSVHTPWWREPPAGHRASGRGPMQTCCLRGPHFVELRLRHAVQRPSCRVCVGASRCRQKQTPTPGRGRWNDLPVDRFP